MADQNNNGDVAFDADPKLEAGAGGARGPADVEFEPDAEAEAKPSTTQQLREKAAEFGNQAADRARNFAGEGKERLTGGLDELAKMMESAAGDVDSRLGASYGQYARSAAKGISSFADGVRSKEIDDILDDASDFIRKSPAVAVGVAAGLGFVLARLVKSGIDAASDLGETAAGAATRPANTDKDPAGADKA